MHAKSDANAAVNEQTLTSTFVLRSGSLCKGHNGDPLLPILPFPNPSPLGEGDFIVITAYARLFCDEGCWFL